VHNRTQTKSLKGRAQHEHARYSYGDTLNMSHLHVRIWRAVRYRSTQVTMKMRLCLLRITTRRLQRCCWDQRRQAMVESRGGFLCGTACRRLLAFAKRPRWTFHHCSMPSAATPLLLRHIFSSIKQNLKQRDVSVRALSDSAARLQIPEQCLQK